MKKIILIFAIIALAASCQRSIAPFKVAFYNVENLFDLVDDPDTQDEEFALGGRKNVDQDILDLKLKNMAEVLQDLNADVIGFCEVENRAVLDMLNEEFSARNYSIIHYDSPDERGIDNALFYDPEVFQVIKSEPVQITLPDGGLTRDVLYILGQAGNEKLHLFVNHWPSHWGGTEQTIPLRAATARQVRQQVLNILNKDPEANIIVMGDLNDIPVEPSIVEHLGASMDREKVGTGNFILWNLMKDFHDPPGNGTYKYNDEARVLDQMIISPGLYDDRGLDLVSGSIGVLDMPKYRQHGGRFDDYPFRFWAGNRVLGGYSDHLAIFLEIELK